MHLPTSRRVLVGMVEAAEDRDRADRPRTARQLPRYRLRERLAAALVGPRPVEGRDGRAERAGEVALARDEQVVQAFAAHAAQGPFAGRIRRGVR